MTTSLTLHVGFPSPTIADVRTSEWTNIAREAEDLGFDTIWHSNERFYREMFVRMTVSALATSSIEIGGAIVEPFSVHPAVTAQSLATLHELSGGRAAIALGAGGSGFPMMGIERKRPAIALREAGQIMRAMLRGESVTLEGDIVQAREAHLHFEPLAPAPPVWMATRGDRTLAVAGAGADGAVIATYARPKEIEAALGLVRQGAERAGRDPSDVRVMARVDTCVHDDAETAYAGSRLMVAKLLWTSYPDRGFVERAGLTVPEELETIIARRDYDALHDVEHLIPDAFVDAFCWAGTPERIAERVVEVVRETGITEVGFWLLRARDQSVSDAMCLIAEQVLPRVREGVAAPVVG